MGACTEFQENGDVRHYYHVQGASQAFLVFDVMCLQVPKDAAYSKKFDGLTKFYNSPFQIPPGHCAFISASEI